MIRIKDIKCSLFLMGCIKCGHLVQEYRMPEWRQLQNAEFIKHLDGYLLGRNPLQQDLLNNWLERDGGSSPLGRILLTEWTFHAAFPFSKIYDGLKDAENGSYVAILVYSIARQTGLTIETQTAKGLRRRITALGIIFDLTDFKTSERAELYLLILLASFVIAMAGPEDAYLGTIDKTLKCAIPCAPQVYILNKYREIIANKFTNMTGKPLTTNHTKTYCQIDIDIPFTPPTETRIFDICSEIVEKEHNITLINIPSDHSDADDIFTMQAMMERHLRESNSDKAATLSSHLLLIGRKIRRAFGNSTPNDHSSSDLLLIGKRLCKDSGNSTPNDDLLTHTASSTAGCCYSPIISDPTEDHNKIISAIAYKLFHQDEKVISEQKRWSMLFLQQIFVVTQLRNGKCSVEDLIKSYIAYPSFIISAIFKAFYLDIAFSGFFWDNDKIDECSEEVKSLIAVFKGHLSLVINAVIMQYSQGHRFLKWDYCPIFIAVNRDAYRWLSLQILDRIVGHKLLLTQAQQIKVSDLFSDITRQECMRRIYCMPTNSSETRIAEDAKAENTFSRTLRE